MIRAIAAEAQPNPFTCIWQCSGNSPTSGFGAHFVSAGDANGDGFDDILITATGDSVVYLYYGGNPMDTIPDLVFNVPHDAEFGYLPNECKDVNGDGYPDIAIESHRYVIPYGFMYMYFGGPEMDNEPDLIFTSDSTGSFRGMYGYYSSMGDFNGDGFYDFVVSNDSYDPLDIGSGKIYVYYGGPDIDVIPDWTVSGDYNNIGSLGGFLFCSGDINNDGTDDIVSLGNITGYSQGVVLYNGGTQTDTISDWTIQSVNYFLNWGIPIIPDFNGDNCDEVVYSTGSDAYIYFGGVHMDDTADVILNGFGWYVFSIASIGDINNDGVQDFATAATGHGYNIYLLNSSMIGNVYYDYWIPFDDMRSIKYAGDVNGDGIDDFMLCTSYNSIGYNWQGQVFIYSDTSLAAVMPKYIFSIPQFELQQNYPNPFNYNTIIPFQLHKSAEINITVYDILGQKVVELFDGGLNSGNHQVIWNAEGLASGSYFIKMSAGKKIENRIIQLIK